MIYWQNRILTNVKKAVSDLCTIVVSSENSIKTKFPAILVKVVSNAAVADDLDMGADGENAVRCIVTIEAYVKTSFQDGLKLMDSANSAMYAMGFKRRQGPLDASIESLPDVTRIVARYVRIIGANDTINLIET